ncbi:MAG: Cytochrome c [Candidatus Magnetoglobus multicellularis str. Araruama]|uniref:Cytochrome c n=1 Tax=Candidatus Magnetoglobus multicellularis str. Araruama TaxID=890399 RepID=A0A1V1PGK5_9BACT|nr:MAG: Cytochrome c [Candidatus Magnetoglobus multicellularis str. Araruama]
MPEFIKNYRILYKTICLTGLTVICLFSSISLQSFDKKSLFMSKCCSCHNGSGEAKTISPSMNAVKQWKRFFKKNKHKRKYKDISAVVSEAESDAILSYLIEHAADSQKPQAFGLR